MLRRQSTRKKLWMCLYVFVPLVLFITIVLQKYSDPLAGDWHIDLSLVANRAAVASEASTKTSAGPCVIQRNCPADHFSFYMQSGAASVVRPKICINNKLVLGVVLNNAEVGLNIVVLNGKTGEVRKTDNFDMYGGEVNPLIEFLKNIEKDSVVLIASFDDPATKLNSDARTLISKLGSSLVHSLGFRDNWVFVGGNVAETKINFEKYLKNDPAHNKYEKWPEVIDLQGCIPKYLEGDAALH